MPVARVDTSRSAYTAGLFHVHNIGSGMHAVVHSSGAVFHEGAPFHAARAYADFLALQLGARGADATGYGWMYDDEHHDAVNGALRSLDCAFPEAQLVGADQWSNPARYLRPPPRSPHALEQTRGALLDWLTVA